MFFVGLGILLLARSCYFMLLTDGKYKQLIFSNFHLGRKEHGLILAFFSLLLLYWSFELWKRTSSYTGFSMPALFLITSIYLI